MSNYSLINPRMGTLNHVRYSNGNCYPVVAVPHGMAFFTIQTNSQKNEIGSTHWFYSPIDKFFEGVRLTHMPSPWLGDYGKLLIYAQRGALSQDACYWSSYDPEKTIIEPAYMKAYVERDRYSIELTPTNACAAIRIRFDSEGGTRRVVFTGESLDYSFDNGTLYVSTTQRIREYIVIRAAEHVDMVASGSKISLEVDADEVNLYLATSFISYTQAELNLKNEIGGKCFDEVKATTEKLWCSSIDVIKAEDADQERLRVFYSCLYRSLLWPRRFYEINENGDPIHINTATGEPVPGYLYTDNGFWDTFRTLYPLYSIIDPSAYREFAEGFYNYYVDTGWLPKWVCPYNVNCMPGMLIEATMGDAIVKDIVSGDLAENIYLAMLKDGEYASCIKGEGRVALSEYRKFGYVPYTVAKESVNETLDNSFGDFAIAMAAKKLGHNDVYERYIAYSENYRNLFDPNTGFMRGKDELGNFRSEMFDPYMWGRDYTEGSAWQNSFGVYHNIEGLNELYGGRLADKIDELMNAPTKYNVGSYNKTIHEMSEMVAANYGQCAISNQPSFHVPFIYSELGDVAKTAYHVERLSRLYTSGFEGYPGDEDNGSASAWYILAAMGLYQMAPSRPDFTVSLPLLDHIKIRLPDGKLLDINKRDYDIENLCHRIKYSDIMHGGSLANMLKKR